MGKSKSKTGIGFVDNTVNAVSDMGNTVGQGVSDLGQTIGGVAQDLGKNAERNVQSILQGTGMVLSGDFNNIGSTLADMALAGVTGGASLLVNPNDRKKIMGETAVQRKVREGEEVQQAQAAADLATQAAEKERQNASNIAGIVGGYRMSPGRRSTLLTVPQPRNTLLTLLGG